MNKYPILSYTSEKHHDDLQDSTEIISEDIPLEENKDIKPKTDRKNSLEIKNNLNFQKENSIYSRLQELKDIFMDKRLVEITDVKTTTEWLILEQRVYSLKTYKKKDEEKTEITEVERRFSDFEWLFLELKYKYPGIIIPLLPEKSPFVKINIMNEKSHEFLEMRKKSLAIFLTKILRHDELKYTPEVKKFIEENSQQFEITKESSQNLNQNSKTIIGSLYSYVNSFWQSKKIRENNPDDILLEKEKKIMESQLLKLNEIIKAIHQLFSNKKEEKKTYGEMSSVFLSLKQNEKLESAAEVLNSLKEKTEKISIIQEKKIKEYIELIEIPLNENARFIVSCIETIDERLNLEEKIFKTENEINDIKGKDQSEKENILLNELDNDKKRVEFMTANLKIDLKNFKIEINNDINNLLKLYKEMQTKNSMEMFQIWNKEVQK